MENVPLHYDAENYRKQARTYRLIGDLDRAAGCEAMATYAEWKPAEGDSCPDCGHPIACDLTLKVFSFRCKECGMVY